MNEWYHMGGLQKQNNGRIQLYISNYYITSCFVFIHPVRLCWSHVYRPECVKTFLSGCPFVVSISLFLLCTYFIFLWSMMEFFSLFHLHYLSRICSLSSSVIRFHPLIFPWSLIAAVNTIHHLNTNKAVPSAWLKINIIHPDHSAVHWRSLGFSVNMWSLDSRDVNGIPERSWHRRTVRSTWGCYRYSGLDNPA